MNSYLTQLFSNSNESDLTILGRIRFLNSIAIKILNSKDLSFLNNTKIVLDRVNDTENIGTRHTRVGTIIKAIELAPTLITKKAADLYKKLYDNLSIQKNEIVNNNIMSDKQKENNISINDLESLLDNKLNDIYKRYNLDSFPSNFQLTKLKKDNQLYKFGSDFQKFISMAAYVYQPALRNNYAGMRWALTKKQASEDDQNYYLKKSIGSKIIMRRYKNDYSLGEQSINVRNKLNQYMKQWYVLLTKMLNQYPTYVLYYTITGKTIKYNSNTDSFKKQLPRIFNDITPLHITINSLRHAWENKIQSDPNYNNMTINEKEELHRELLHRFDVAQRYQLLDRD